MRYAHSTRRYLVLTVVLGGCTAFLVVAQAWLLATAVSGAFIDHKGVAQLKVPVALLFLAVWGGPWWDGSRSGWPTGRRPGPSQSFARPWWSASPDWARPDWTVSGRVG